VSLSRRISLMQDATIATEESAIAHREALTGYQIALDTGRVDMLEMLRQQIHDTLDAYLDNYGAAKRLAQGH
jgi:hypothetical protein